MVYMSGILSAYLTIFVKMSKMKNTFGINYLRKEDAKNGSTL